MMQLTEEKGVPQQVIETRIQVLKTALPRKYSTHNTAILRARLTEYKFLIESLGKAYEKAKTKLYSNFNKLEQRIASIELPDNTIATSRYYYHEAITFMTIELINIAHIINRSE